MITKLYAALARQLMRFVSRLLFHLAIQLAVCVFIVASFWIDRTFDKFVIPAEIAPPVQTQPTANAGPTVQTSKTVDQSKSKPTPIKPISKRFRVKRYVRRIKPRSISTRMFIK